MKLIKVILSIIITFVVLWTIVAFFSPKYMGVKESIVIERNASTIFNQVNNFKNWKNWSEWNRRDSLMKVKYANPFKGENGQMSWESEDEGNGSIKITESIPFEKIRLLVSINDYGDNFSNWQFIELKDFQTEVTWTFEDSEISFFLRPMSFSLNNFIRDDYVKGLENLKVYCENEKQQNKKIRPTIVQSDSIIYIAKHITCADEDAVTEKEKAYNQLTRLYSDNKWTIEGFPFAIIYDSNEGFVEFDLAFRMEELVKAPRGYISGMIPSGQRATVTHYGLLDNLPASYKLIENWIRENGFSPIGNPYEFYISGSEAEADSSKWETQIFYPIIKSNNGAILN